MKLLRVLSSKGWRRTGAINVILAYVCCLILMVCLLVSILQPGSSIGSANIFFEGDCSKSARINFLLHMFLNIVSSAVLASSNFFMQVLSSPSRQEIDQAHTWLRSLDIGIPSVSNIRHVSWFKRIGWVILFFSSIPLHLFFNSSIFETTYRGSQWHLTISTEAFTQGATFFPPGGSLSPAGAPRPDLIYDEVFQMYEFPKIKTYDNATGSYDPPYEDHIVGYGQAVVFDDYWNASSLIRRNISLAANEASTWTLLNNKDCQDEYRSYNPRIKYGDVVVIIESDATNSTGWTRSQVFDFDPSSNLSSYWDTRVPPDSINSLWFSAQCSTFRTLSESGRRDTYNNTCLGALGIYGEEVDDGRLPPFQENWTLAFNPFSGDTGDARGALQDLRYNNKFDSFQVRHCLAQSIQQHCKVGVSNGLLLVTISCILVKAVQGTIVVWRLSAASLVVPGDAIQSFISNPDPQTQGLGTLDIIDSERLEVSIQVHIRLAPITFTERIWSFLYPSTDEF